MLRPGAGVPGRPLRIVAFGGGTGLSNLLRGLRRLVPAVDVTAVVAVSDDGGSSGRLRQELGIPAVGDARACLAALAGGAAWAGLLEHRFRHGPLKGHPAGNLLLAAAHERTGSLSGSLAQVAQLVGARGRVLPVSDAQVVLQARLADGRLVRGEHVLGNGEGHVERLWTQPDVFPPAPGVIEAVQRADLVVLGPGSLFSSVIASTLAAGVRRALAECRAPKVLIQNLTTQRGETEGLGAAEHARAVLSHLGPKSLDAVLVHAWPGRPPSQGIASDPGQLAALGLKELRARVAAPGGRLHDPDRLARALRRYALGDRDAPRRTRSA